MTEMELQEERRRDDEWNFAKLAVLAVSTLGVALSVIYFFASRAAPF